MITYKQLSLQDVYEDCNKQFKNNKHKFLAILEDSLDFSKIVPPTFRHNFYKTKGRPREYQLYPMLKALLLQRIFSIPTDSLLLLFLNYSAELREFCGFRTVPDAAKITRFKQDFISDLQLMFDHLVDLTEPICQKIDSHKAAMTIFDTSGIEAWVTENNPKYLNKLIKQLKVWKKSVGLDNNYDPHKAAYSKMPTHSMANPAIKQMYINGHFCYAYKFGIITNGLGIVRDITFYNQDFLKDHPEIVIEKKSNSPDEDKTLADSKALIPVLREFFKKHPCINPKYFLGDSAFDCIQIYHDLFHELKFQKAFIPLNNRLALEDSDCSFNEHGIPCCPKDPKLAMKRESSKSHLRCGLPTMKFVCPKMKWRTDPNTKKSKRTTQCQNPCTTSRSGRMFYVYPEKNLRAYPGITRDSDEFKDTYKIRGAVEKGISYFKDSYGLAGRKSRCEKTLHADLLLAGITQLATVLVADHIHQHQFIRSLKPLVA
jgi:transposase